MPLKLFEFREQFMIYTFLIKLAQLRISKIFISLGNLMVELDFRN